jgi:phenylalanyl-tRNA synthetase alpha chain
MTDEVTPEKGGTGLTPAEMEAAVKEFSATALSSIDAVTTLGELDELEPTLVGRRAPFGGWKRALGTLDPSDRPAAGQVLNAGLAQLESAIAEKRALLGADARLLQLAADRFDLTEAIVAAGPGHLHLVTQIRDELEDVFLGMGYEIAEGSEIETDWYNFTALNMPKHHSARSIQDSFYLDLDDGESWLLRSQTSPVQIHLLERGALPIYAVAPGRVYRRDTADARHLPVFHQIEGIVVDRGVTFSDLKGTIDTFVKAIFGGEVSARLRPAYFPFTEPSAEFEITCTICKGAGCRTCSQTGWIELGGCGMIHPAVFEATGVDAEVYTGFAFGFGIDRLAIMRHGVDDIRSFLENDIRFLSQF